jgi:uncharacterized membrane protein YgdD (TMEM256/DUF423 family)
MNALARWQSAFAAVACGLSVALAAYASHVAQAQDGRRLAIAAAFAFGHGLALLVLASRPSLLARAASLSIGLGVVLFSGSLGLAVLLGAPTSLAPFGGGLLMLGWGILAVDFIRAR